MMDSDSISQPVLRDRKNHTITSNVANSNSPGQNSDADGVGVNSNDVALMAKLQAQVRAFILPSVYSMLVSIRVGIITP